MQLSPLRRTFVFFLLQRVPKKQFIIMIRKFTFLFLLSIMAFSKTMAQNIQLHYDFGSRFYDSEIPTRTDLTTTIEGFHVDNWGSSYYFVDIDINSNGVKGAYTEISRDIKLGKSPFCAHVEYNGGLNHDNTVQGGVQYTNAYLGGIDYVWNAKDFTKGLTIQAMYKYIQHNSSPNNFQVTCVWYMNMVDGLLSFSGFADLWREKSLGSTMKFLSEPQFWVNLNKFKSGFCELPISVGTEVEISNNFVMNESDYTANKFYMIPTLAVKWTFK